MTYKDTIFKQGAIHWKPTKFKESKDGKIDLNVVIPLATILDGQAKQSFMRGVAETLAWMGDCQSKKIFITQELLDSKFKEWDIPELSEVMRRG